LSNEALFPINNINLKHGDMRLGDNQRLFAAFFGEAMQYQGIIDKKQGHKVSIGIKARCTARVALR